jgi:beta-lactamase superfamily II metal-dependent hydrolase
MFTEHGLPTSVAIRVEALPAGAGDSILVNCQTPNGVWRCLVDLGPGDSSGTGKTWPLLYDRLSRVPIGADGRRRIDLLVITHIDHDHIGAHRQLFADPSLGLTFGDIWFNGRRHLNPPRVRGVAEAEALTVLLDKDLPWNRATNGAAVAVASTDPGFRDLAAVPHITLLAPSTERLQTLAASWDAECEHLHRREPNTPDEGVRGAGFPDLHALAARTCAQNRTPTNGSSIAVLLEHGGASVLLAGDAFANDIAHALYALALHRGLSPPLHLDAVKLSHHGSRASLTTDLFRTLIADYYLISTDNHRYGHPHDEALARVVLYGGPRPVLCFNHTTPKNLRWANDDLQRSYHFASRFPVTAADGVAIDLPRRSRDRLQPARRSSYDRHRSPSRET